MTKKQNSYFGSDGKLLVLKTWIYKDKSYSARRGTDDCIGIVSDENYYACGNSGIDYCYDEKDIDNLFLKMMDGR